jgi:pimeloyl-ACP methyl ester carboxylesterase
MLPAVTCLLSVLLSSVAQDTGARPAEAVERFTCETYDGVRLVGDFHPPGRGRGQRAPCVILLHPIGPGRATASRRDFGTLPRRLQDEGLAVVTFDFRGHGESLVIDPAKYLIEAATQLRAPRDRPPAKIDVHDFRTARDYERLANDRVAVKVWLNGKSNDRACNARNVALIGVEQAGVVGLMWLANEHQDVNRAADRAAVKNNKADRYEGEDVAAVVWLSTADRLGSDRVDSGSLQRWLNLLRERKTQTLAVVAESDAAGKAFWDKAQNWIKTNRDKDLLQPTRVHRVKGTSLAGLKLLENEALSALPELIQFLDDTVETNLRDWAESKGNAQPTPINFRALGP